MRNPTGAARTRNESAGGRNSEPLDPALAAALPVRTTATNAAATVSRRRDRTVSLLKGGVLDSDRRVPKVSLLSKKFRGEDSDALDQRQYGTLRPPQPPGPSQAS